MTSCAVFEPESSAASAHNIVRSFLRISLFFPGKQAKAYDVVDVVIALRPYGTHDAVIAPTRTRF